MRRKSAGAGDGTPDDAGGEGGGAVGPPSHGPGGNSAGPAAGVFRPYMARGRERRLTRRLLENDGARYVDDWRPPGCEKKLGEIVEDDTGRRFLFVKCDACSARYNGTRYHVMEMPRGNLRTDRPKHGER